jgi:glycosyltransferase involved in cell wall biosynthesis
MAGKAVRPVIVPPGMNIAYHKLRRHSFHNPPFKIIDVGYVLIKAASLLTDRDLELHFIGDYDHYHREYYDRCQVLVSNLNLQKRVFFHGFVSRKILDRLMTEADLYVSPSYLEGYGISVMEAASFSLPLVLSDLPAFREIAGDSACYFPPGDFRRLAGVIGSLLKDPTRRMKLGKLAYGRVDFSYDWDKMRARTKKEIMDWWCRLHGNKGTIETKIN